jgi:hypothetical protein
MAYLKGSRVTGLSPKPIDVKGFTQSASEDLEGTYSQHEVLLADAFNVTDNVTISDNLILTKLSDDGNAITVTGDASTTRTISGSGSLEGSTFAQTPNASLTGMTGTIGTAVLSQATFEGTLNSATTFSGDAGQRTAKAWCNFDSTGTFTLNDSHNISSVTDHGVGNFEVNFDTNMGNTDYAVGAASSAGGTQSGYGIYHKLSRAGYGGDDLAVGSFGISIGSHGYGVRYDFDVITVIVFGD